MFDADYAIFLLFELSFYAAMPRTHAHYFLRYERC